MKLAMIDGNGAIRPAIEKGGDGTRSLLKLLGGLRHSYTHAVVAFDSTTRSARKEIYPEYKANRPPATPELLAKIFAAYRTARRHGFCCTAVEGWEADDVIATLARRAERKSVDVVVMARDKDFRQLLSPRIKMWHRKTGLYGVDNLLSATGLTPSQWLDFQALVGDASDNIKGVKGIGEKAASELLLQHGNIDGIYRNLSQIAGRRQQLLEAGRDSLYLSLALVTLNDSLEIPLDPHTSRLKQVQNKCNP